MNNLIPKIFLAGVVVFMCAPFLTFAQPIGTPAPGTPIGTPAPAANPPIKVTIPNILRSGITDVKSLIDVIIDDIVIPIGGVICVLIIMWAGFLFVTAGGDSSKITKAKDTLLYGAIGAAIILGAKVISEVVQATVTQLK